MEFTRKATEVKVISSPDTEEDLSKCICTHSGTFHCDEALACGLLRMLPEYQNSTIVRTRKEELIEKCAIVVDVGGVYASESNRFDHHQRSFDTVLAGFRQS